MALDFEQQFDRIANAKRTKAFNFLKKQPEFHSILKERGRRYGVYMNSPEGLIYLAVRLRREIYRNGKENVNLSEAEDAAAWAIDYGHILTFNAKDVVKVGVYEIESGDIYSAPLDAWKDAPVIDYTHKRGSMQKALLIKDMEHALGMTKYR